MRAPDGTDQQELICVGLMSGTSVDGVDVAVVAIAGAPPSLRVRLLHFETLPYDEEIRQKIFRLFEPTATIPELADMHFVLGHAFADAVLTVLGRAGIEPSQVACISSHGQTVYHHPEPTTIGPYRITSTLQIGEPAVIAERTGIPVISDFRPRDMAAGGQGAPLVPFVDLLLFSHPHKGRIAANIGGIANLTVLPAGCSPEQVVAFDTGPGNMLIDGLVRRMTGGRLAYDPDGQIARSGRVREELLAKWLAHPYLSQPPPKSTGRETFGEQCAQQWWEEGQRLGIPPEDLVATATEFTVRSFTEAIREFVLPRHPIAEVIVGGGGAHNPVIMEGIARALPDQRVMPQEATGIPSDAKEAVAFAVLGYEALHLRPNNLPSATGARHSVILGKLTPGQPRG